jgi:hypothetical protein
LHVLCIYICESNQYKSNSQSNTKVNEKPTQTTTMATKNTKTGKTPLAVTGKPSTKGKKITAEAVREIVREEIRKELSKPISIKIEKLLASMGASRYAVIAGV